MVNSPAEYHVIVIGAGVAGLLTCVILSKLDPTLNIALIDHTRPAYPNITLSPGGDEPSNDTLTNNLPSDHVWIDALSLEILDKFDLLEDIIQAAKPIHSAIISSSSHVFKDLKWFPRNPHTKFNSGIVIEQWKLERFLCNSLQPMNVDVYRFHAVTNVRVSGDADISEFPVVLTAREYAPAALTFQWAAEARTFNTKFVVGADGHHSIVRRALEIEMIQPVPDAPSYEYMLADYLMSPADDDRGITEDITREGTPDKLASDGTTLGEDWYEYLQIIHRASGTGIILPYAQQDKFRLIMRRQRQNGPTLSVAEDEREDPDREELLYTQMSTRSISPPFEAGTPQRREFSVTSYKKLSPASDDQLKHIGSVIFGKNWSVKDVLWKRAFTVKYEMAQTAARVGILKDQGKDVVYGGILIGNAARGAPPLWSLPLNMSIHDAHNLCWRLVCVLSFRGSYTLLNEDFNNERITATKKVFEEFAHGIDQLLDAERLIQAEKWTGNKLINSLAVHKLFGLAPDIDLSRDLTNIVTMGSEIASVIGLSSIRVIGFQSYDRAATAKVTNLLEPMKNSTMKNYLLIVLLRVLPQGTKIRTVFGCERPELAERYSLVEFETLMQLAKTVSTSKRNLTVCWVFTPGPKHVLPESEMEAPAKQVQKLPADLLSRVPDHHETFYDHDLAAYNAFHLTFTEPVNTPLARQTCREENKKGCGAGYVIIRPDNVLESSGVLRC